MTLNADLIRARCTEIEASLRRLEEIGRLPLDAFLADQDTLDIACYRLLVAIEAALALCFHVSARRLRQAPGRPRDPPGGDDRERGIDRAVRRSRLDVMIDGESMPLRLASASVLPGALGVPL